MKLLTLFLFFASFSGSALGCELGQMELYLHSKTGDLEEITFDPETLLLQSPANLDGAKLGQEKNGIVFVKLPDGSVKKNLAAFCPE